MSQCGGASDGRPPAVSSGREAVVSVNAASALTIAKYDAYSNTFTTAAAAGHGRDQLGLEQHTEVRQTLR